MAQENNMFTGAVILLLVITVLGIDLTSNNNREVEEIWHTHCLDVLDNNNDGDYDSERDKNCQEYPYMDGNGENETITKYPEGENGYEPYNDFMKYADYSYNNSAVPNSYPGSIEDWKCDLVIMGATKYITEYDSAFGTSEDSKVNDHMMECQANNNGIIGNQNMKPGNPGGEESEEQSEEQSEEEARPKQ